MFPDDVGCELWNLRLSVGALLFSAGELHEVDELP